MWLEEGFIFQSSMQEYHLGQGPFSYSSQPSSQSLYHPDFFLKDTKPWLKPSLLWKANQEELVDFLFEEEKPNFAKKNNFGGLYDSVNVTRFFQDAIKPSFVLYQQVFYQARQFMQRGLFQKIVPVFSESFSLKPPRLRLIQNLFKKTHQMSHGFLYGAWDKKRGILGFTPEILFSIKGNQLSTMALAGTGTHLGPSLLKDPKELKEHHFVVRSLQEALKDFVKWEQKITSELLFPPLKHLHTELKGHLIQPSSFETICKSLHPTAALGGYPKKPALTWLQSQPSQQRRHFFGAPFGFFDSNKKSFCLVALRALEWNEEKSFIFSGGGLIRESLLQKEWRELDLKRQQVKKFFI